jgi:hypothetical protein
MTSRLNTALTVGMLAGVTIIAGGAAPAAALTITVNSAEAINLAAQGNDTPGAPSASGTLTFAGFAGPGTLTGVLLTFNSSLFGESEGGPQPEGNAAVSFGTETAEHLFTATIQFSGTGPTPYDFTAEMLDAGNPFGTPFNAAAFTSTSAIFNLSLIATANTGNWVDLGWTGPVATLTYTYTAAAVPLPAALPLMAIGLGALGFAARRRA